MVAPINNVNQTTASGLTNTSATTSVSSINFTQAVNEEVNAQLDKELRDAVHGFTQQGAVTWGRGIRWRNALGSEGKDLTSQMFHTWNTSRTEEGFYKLRTALKESGIIAEDTIAKIPERLANMRDAIDGLGSRLNSDYATDLKAKISNAESAIANLHSAVGDGGKIENLTNKEEITAALREAETAFSELNAGYSLENLTANINYSGKADWLQDGLDVNKHYLKAMGRHATYLGYSGVEEAATALNTAMQGYIKGDSSITNSTLISATADLENALESNGIKNSHDLDGMLRTLLTADSAGLSDADKANALNDFNMAVYGVRNTLAREHSAAARADKTVQKSFEVQADATRAVIDRIYEKYDSVANSNSDLGEIDELLEGVANVADRLASGDSTNRDLHAIRALENIISARLQDIENVTNEAESNYVLDLRGESVSYGNASVNPGLDNIPGNSRYIYEQLAYGGIAHFREGIINNILSTVSALDRLSKPAYDTQTLNNSARFYHPQFHIHNHYYN